MISRGFGGFEVSPVHFTPYGDEGAPDGDESEGGGDGDARNGPAPGTAGTHSRATGDTWGTALGIPPLDFADSRGFA